MSDTLDQPSSLSREQAVPRRPIDRRVGALLLAGGAAAFVGGNLHPRADTDAEYEEAVAEMLEHSAWTASHLIALVGMVLLGAGFVLFARTSRARSDAPLLTALRVGIFAATLQAVELIPHTLADGERDELLAGDSTPWLDTHMVLQAVSTPLLGLSVAAVAVIEARGGRLWTRLVAALAVVGGVAYGLAGPLIVLTEDPAVSPLFAGAAGMSVWAAATGARYLAERRAVVSTPAAVR